MHRCNTPSVNVNEISIIIIVRSSKIMRPQISPMQNKIKQNKSKSWEVTAFSAHTKIVNGTQNSDQILLAYLKVMHCGACFRKYSYEANNVLFHSLELYDSIYKCTNRAKEKKPAKSYKTILHNFVLCYLD